MKKLSDDARNPVSALNYLTEEAIQMFQMYQSVQNKHQIKETVTFLMVFKDRNRLALRPPGAESNTVL